MKDFAFKFHALLRYRRHRRDLVRMLLAQILNDERSLAAEHQAVSNRRLEQLDELRRLGQGGGVDIDRAAARRYYAGQLTGELLALERRRQIVADQLRLCRQALAKADQDVKMLEKLEEKQRAAFRHEQERRAARELEDAWLAVRTTEFRT